MKTSNKLLVAVAVLLATAAVANALALKSRLTAMMAAAPAELRDFPVAHFKRIDLSGTPPTNIGGRLRVTVKQAEHFDVKYTRMDFIHLQQLGETLKITVDHTIGYDTDVKQVPELIIECPALEAFTAIGTSLDSLDLPQGTNEATRRYIQKSQVTIGGFHTSRMNVVASDGMEVTLDGLEVDSLITKADRASTVLIKRNVLGHVALRAGDEATITLDHSQIGTIATEVAEKGQFIVIGTQLSAHGKHH